MSGTIVDLKSQFWDSNKCQLNNGIYVDKLQTISNWVMGICKEKFWKEKL